MYLSSTQSSNARPIYAKQTIFLDGENDYIDIPTYTIADGDVIDMRFNVLSNKINTADGSGGIRNIFSGARDADNDGRYDYFAIYDGADALSNEVANTSSGATGRQIFRNYDVTNISADREKQIQVGDGIVDVKLVISGDDVTSTIDGAESQTEAAEFVGFTLRRIAAGKARRYLHSRWHHFKITNGSGVVQRNYQMQGSNGTTTIIDSASSNHGTLVSTDLTSAWGTRVYGAV